MNYNELQTSFNNLNKAHLEFVKAHNEMVHIYNNSIDYLLEKIKKLEIENSILKEIGGKYETSSR